MQDVRSMDHRFSKKMRHYDEAEEVSMSKSKMKKLYLPLPPETHTRLIRESEVCGVPTTALAREAISDWLDRRERERIARYLRAFALENAGSEFDLEEQFESASADTLA